MVTRRHLIDQKKSSDNHMSRLTDDTSEDIRRIYDELSKNYCVARGVISYLINFYSPLYKIPDI